MASVSTIFMFCVFFPSSVDMTHRYRKDFMKSDAEKTLTKKKLKRRLEEQWVSLMFLWLTLLRWDKIHLCDIQSHFPLYPLYSCGLFKTSAPKHNALMFGISFALVSHWGSQQHRKLREILKILHSVLSASNLAKLWLYVL